MAMKVTFRYGSGNEISKELTDGTKLGVALKMASISAGLGYGSNVEGHIGGVPQSNDTELRPGMVVSVYDKACAKAA